MNSSNLSFHCVSCFIQLDVDPSLLETESIQEIENTIIENEDFYRSTLGSHVKIDQKHSSLSDQHLKKYNEKTKFKEIFVHDSFVVLPETIHSILEHLQEQHSSNLTFEKSALSSQQNEKSISVDIKDRICSQEQSFQKQPTEYSKNDQYFENEQQVKIEQHSQHHHRSEDKGTLSHRLKVAEQLFDIVSGTSTIDHPLCKDCGDELLSRLERRLEELKLDNDVYTEYLKSFEHEKMNENDLEELEHQVKKLELQEKEAFETLKQLQLEHEAIQKDIEKSQLDLEILEEKEASTWQQFDTLQDNVLEKLREKIDLDLKTKSTHEHFEFLQRANVYHDAFKICHDGPFGTICGLRLGRLPQEQVDWSEINAALGQVLLLLDVVTNKIKFQFKNYRLIPLGNYSRIEKITGDKTIYELYGSGDLRGILFWNRRFDSALVALLDCIQQLGDYAESQDHKFKLPYRIDKDKVGDISIKFQFNQDENWTKALKYVLINLKWIVAFCCSSRFQSSVQEPKKNVIS